MAKKVLKGTEYGLARLVGIKSEMWAEHLGREPNLHDTMYATGEITKVGDDYGLVLDDKSQPYPLLPDVHKARLVDATKINGWVKE